MKKFNYHQPTKIVFGSGRISEAGEIIKEFGKRCLLVTTPAVPGTEVQFEKIKEIIRSAGVELAHFDQVIPAEWVCGNRSRTHVPATIEDMFRHVHRSKREFCRL